MKLLLLRENLKRILSVVSPAVGSSSLPVLKNILVKTENNSVYVSATNLDLAITTVLPAKIKKEGTTTIPFQALSTIVNNISSEKIQLEIKDSTVVVKTDNYNATLQTLNESEFPIIPRSENTQESIDIDGGILKKAFTKVLTAAAVNTDFRPELAGVQFRFENNSIVLAATDSFRLAEKNINSSDFSSSFEKSFSCILPSQNISEVIKILPENKIKCYFDENQAVFKNKETEIVSRRIDGKFPEYQAIIPKEFNTRITLSTDDFLEGLKLSNVFTGRLNDVVVKIMENKKALSIFSKESGVGENNYILPAKIEGDVFEVVFNIKYILDGIRSINRDSKSDKLFVGLNKEKKPSVIRDPKDNSYIYILMPIKQ